MGEGRTPLNPEYFRKKIWIQLSKLYKKIISEEIMLTFVGKAFRGWINFILWITIIGCAIGGLAFGINIEGEFAITSIVLTLVGALIGLILDILIGGYIANFLNMVDNIEKLARSQDL
jgi:hypothetical protein